MLGEDGVEAEDHIVRAGARRGALDPQVRRQICVREFCATRHFISFRGSSVNFDLARRPEQFDAAIPVGRLAHIDRDLLAGNGAGRTVCHADAALCGQVDLHDVDLAGVEAGGGQYLGFGEDSRAARSGLGKGITASRSFIPYAPVPEGRARAQIAVSRQYEHVATVMDADILPCLFDIDLQRIDGCRVGFARAGEGYINRSWLDAVQAQRDLIDSVRVAAGHSRGRNVDILGRIGRLSIAGRAGGEREGSGRAGVVGLPGAVQRKIVGVGVDIRGRGSESAVKRKNCALRTYADHVEQHR